MCAGSAGHGEGGDREGRGGEGRGGEGERVRQRRLQKSWTRHKKWGSLYEEDRKRAAAAGWEGRTVAVILSDVGKRKSPASRSTNQESTEPR